MSDKDYYQLPSNCDFQSITNSHGKNICSPQLNHRFFSPFRGVAINLPAKVSWPKDVALTKLNPGFLQYTTGPLRLMLAEVARFDKNDPLYRYLNGKDTLVIAVDQSDGTVYSGRAPRVPHISYSPSVDPCSDGF